MKLKLTIAYFGQRYHGWQRQAGVPTVQQCLEDAAARVFKEPVHVVGASRTDTGVHAEGQAATMVVSRELPPDRVRMALNSRLPTDIDVRHVEPVDDNFDLRRDVCWKTYRYRIHNAADRPTADWGRVWHYWRTLDDELVRQAADRLTGTHDFAGLAHASKQPRATTVRTLYGIDVLRHYRQLIIDVSGNGFLYRMVRNIVGALMEVGRGHQPIQWIDRLLCDGAAARAQAAPPSAPAQGLTLLRIHFAPHPAEPNSGQLPQQIQPVDQQGDE